MPYAIKKQGNVWIVYNKRTGKTKGRHPTKAKALAHLRALYANVPDAKERFELVWEAQDLKLQTEEKDGTKWLRVDGIALVASKSANGINYTIENLQENDGASFNWIVGHRADYDNPDHNVGEGKYYLDGDKLRFTGRIKNNKTHPDIVEQVLDGLVAPSIQGGVEDIQTAVSETGEVSVHVSGLKIPIIALVNKHVRGVKAASIEAAIAESLAARERVEKDIVVDGVVTCPNCGEVMEKVKQDKQSEVSRMSEDVEQLKKLLQERDEAIKKLKEQMVLKEKEMIVESILSINEKLDKSELMKKSTSELKLIEQYEKKLKEQEELAKKKDEEGAGAGEVENEEQSNTVEEKDKLDGIVIEKDTRFITMNEGLYKRFNEEIKQSIYR